MNKWLKRIRTELLEIYGESYPQFLKAEIVGFASYPLWILLLFLSSQPYIIRTVSSWGMVGIIVIVSFIMFYIEKRYKVKLTQEMEQKYKQTVYYRWISREIRAVLGTLILLRRIHVDSMATTAPTYFPSRSGIRLSCVPANTIAV